MKSAPQFDLSTKVAVPRYVSRIIELLEAGGAADVFIVGGFVRDALFGIPSKDVDVEVYGLNYSQIHEILAPYFHCDLVGRSFGVLKVGRDVDVALPRRESKNGAGHKGFDVETTPNLAPREAFSRRDFTINAIGARRDGTIYDPFDGVGDMRRGILRAVGPAFKDDPLRVLRGVQFAARFGFSMESRTIEYCREIFSEFPTLSEERIYEEWKKWALKGSYPELGLEILRETGWIEGFPELAALVGCPQNPKWHPEGDVWTHVKAVCREAAEAANRFRPELTEDERVVLMFAALGHDFGKPLVTALDENGELRSLGHAGAGAPLARTFLERMKAPTRIVDCVERLVAEHMATQSPGDPSQRMIRRLARRLEPANIKLWALLCQSDALGCGAPQRYLTPDAVENGAELPADELKRRVLTRKIRFRADMWLEIAENLGVCNKAPKPILQGRDLIPIGVKPGPKMGEILRIAFEAQLDGEFIDVPSAIAFLQAKDVL
ncbi:MAG: HD domain-containing protein [Thermoguttaceae bacterium]|nr:HD domain-containing protein [Thermoguttaceae bacterium]